MQTRRSGIADIPNTPRGFSSDFQSRAIDALLIRAQILSGCKIVACECFFLYNESQVTDVTHQKGGMGVFEWDPPKHPHIFAIRVT